MAHFRVDLNYEQWIEDYWCEDARELVNELFGNEDGVADAPLVARGAWGSEFVLRDYENARLTAYHINGTP